MRTIDPQHSSYLKAQYRVEQLRSYYMHLLIYTSVNLVISGVKVGFAWHNGDSFSEAVFQLDTFIVWIIWGVFMAIHSFRVLGLPLVLGYDWEARTLEKFVNEEIEHRNYIN